MSKEKQAAATARYRDKYIRRWVVCVNRRTESDVLEYLEGVRNVSGYVKELVRADMRRERIEKIEAALREPVEQIFTK